MTTSLLGRCFEKEFAEDNTNRSTMHNLFVCQSTPGGGGYPSPMLFPRSMVPGPLLGGGGVCGGNWGIAQHLVPCPFSGVWQS